MLYNAKLSGEPEGARIGLINMWVDERGEDAFKSLMPASVRVFTTRMAADLEAYNREGRFVPLGGMELVAQTLPPNRLSLIAFSCTSGAIAAGEGTIDDSLAAVCPGIPITNPAIAAVEGMRAANIDRFALLTPYPTPMHAQLRPYFESHGFEVVADGTFSVEPDPEVSRISHESFVEAGRHLLSHGADALFVSCTALDIVGSLAVLSRALGKPVYASAQLFAWHSLKLLGLDADAERVMRLSDTQ